MLRSRTGVQPDCSVRLLGSRTGLRTGVVREAVCLDDRKLCCKAYADDRNPSAKPMLRALLTWVFEVVLGVSTSADRSGVRGAAAPARCRAASKASEHEAR